MSIQYQRYKLFSRRSFMLGCGKIGLMGLLGAQMYRLQVIESAKFKTMSDANHIRLIPTPPIRGIIYDRNNNILALNKNNYRVILAKENEAHFEKTIENILNIVELDDDQRKDFLYKVNNQKKQRSIILFDNLSWKDLSSVEVNIPDLPGVYIEVGQTRYYPYNAICAHLIGYVGTVSKEEAPNSSVMFHPDYKIGKNGIEKFFDERLQGIPGYREVEVDAYGNVIQEFSSNPSVPGEDINLALNIKLQDLTYSLLDGKDAAVILMDVNTGEVLAMCSTPSYDPNKFTQGISSDYWKKISSNTHSPLINKTISQQYPPGSVFKIVTAAAIAEAGIDPNTTVHCGGSFWLGNHKFHCWKHEGHGSVNMPSAIQKSCNVYFYTMARRIGFEKIHEVAKKLGLGEKFDLGLIGEVGGILPNRAWKKKRLKQEWHPGDTLNCAIGHGFLATTPMQLAVMTARIASGKMVSPKLTAQYGGLNVKDVDLSEKTLNALRTGMDMVVNKPGGTVFRHKIDNPKHAFAAKTGTAQVVALKHDSVTGKALNDNETWETAHHGWCVGYAPVDSPKFACAVIVEHGGSGSGAAAPVLREVLLKVQEFMES
ncbi:MAG: penicillin-binding protein 2 [Alphaproteobacteria bacterium]|nr:penicillin-binding protein 2 [Alphaproteobacteria bacterium]OJV13530.1 MAG: penicillin-binding protein 2 [Alphaproteobacteria bacterium 33-17]